MPELPEVETIVRGLSAQLPGRVLTEIIVKFPRIINGDARGFVDRFTARAVASLVRHGKSIFIRFEARKDVPSPLMRIHLGMTGQLLIHSAAEPLAPHTHVIFRFEEVEVRYVDIRRFGKIEMIETPKRFTVPDAWTSPERVIVAALRNRRGMAKHALLNQNVIAGLGNIYADESLHLSKIHPRRPLESLSDGRLISLCHNIRAILRRSIRIGGTSFRNYVDTNGRRGGFKDWLKVYGREGERCACGGVIRKTIVVSRGTHFCPRCQRLPSALR